MTVRKIKIIDDSALRNELDALYGTKSQIEVARWALNVADRIISVSGIDTAHYPEVLHGYETNRLWQHGEARMHDVRQVGFALHAVAREQKDEVTRKVFRVIGQAIASGHMKEHGMVASDYAIKVINLLFPDDIERTSDERRWQISALRQMSDI